jgi:hypothetical protein
MSLSKARLVDEDTGKGSPYSYDVRLASRFKDGEYLDSCSVCDSFAELNYATLSVQARCWMSREIVPASQKEVISLMFALISGVRRQIGHKETGVRL